MASPNYRIQFTQAEWDKLHAQPFLNRRNVDLAPAVTRSEQDPKIRINRVSYMIEIDELPFGDFLNIHRHYKEAIFRSADLIVDGADGWMTHYGTDEFRKEQLDLIMQSRDQLRGIGGPANDPNVNLDLTDDTAAAATANTLRNSRGICMGHGHTQMAAYQLLADMARNPAASGLQGGMLFVEELPGYLQTEIDAYLNAAVAPPWSDEAQTFFDSVTTARTLGNGQKLEDMLTSAKANNIKVFAIDSGERTPSIVPKSGFGKQRTCNMNAFAKRVMDNAIAPHPNRKYVVFCGAKHSNTHEGGIPGFSQIYNIPAVTMRDDGTVEDHSEDRNLRGMPCKEVQVFVDQFLISYDIEMKCAFAPPAQYPDREALKANAMRKANDLLIAEILPNPALSNDDLRKAIKALTDQVTKGKAQRYETAKDAIKNGSKSKVKLFLTFEPELVLCRDQAEETKGKNLLSYALSAGAKSATDLIRGHMETVGDNLAASGNIDLQDMAELIVIKASNAARNGNSNDRTEVNAKKHQEIVEKLFITLGNNAGKLGNKTNVVQLLSFSLAANHGFYKKSERTFGTRDPDHVSIDKKSAAWIWVRALAQMP